MRVQTMRAAPPRFVSVNGTVIANADIAREVQNHPDGTPGGAWQAATRALVVRQLLLQRAASLGLASDPGSENGLRETEEEALIRALLEAEIRTPTASEAECRRYYEANRQRFRSPDLYEPLHILFKAARDDAASFAQAEARAAAVLAQLLAAPDSFEAVARAVSDCPSAAEGGRLGQVAPGDTTPEFQAAMAALEPGAIAPAPVPTRYGVHLIRLDRMHPGAVLPFSQTRTRIAEYLEANAARRAAAQYVQMLAGQASISGFEMAGASSPLVQ